MGGVAPFGGSPCARRAHERSGETAEHVEVIWRVLVFPRQALAGDCCIPWLLLLCMVAKMCWLVCLHQFCFESWLVMRLPPGVATAECSLRVLQLWCFFRR